MNVREVVILTKNVNISTKYLDIFTIDIFAKNKGHLIITPDLCWLNGCFMYCKPQSIKYLYLEYIVKYSSRNVGNKSSWLTEEKNYNNTEESKGQLSLAILQLHLVANVAIETEKQQDR